MKKVVNQVGDYCLNLFVNWIVIWGVFVLIQIAFFAFMPSSWWFTYYDVAPKNYIVSVWDELTFKSDTKINRVVDMYWNDILMCDVNWVEQFFSSYDSHKVWVEPHERRSWEWHYAWDVPSFPTTCKLESNIMIKLPFGFSKNQSKMWEQFSIIESHEK